MRTLIEKETYKYSGIFEADTINGIKNDYLRRKRNQAVQQKSHLKGINVWVVHLVTYSGQFLKWTWEQLQKMDQRKRKLIKMHML